MLEFISNTTVCPEGSFIYDGITENIIHPVNVDVSQKEMIERAITYVGKLNRPTALSLSEFRTKSVLGSMILLPILQSPRDSLVIVFEASHGV
jgi:hypothetical protein